MGADANVPFGSMEEEADYVFTIQKFLDLCEIYGPERVYADMKLMYDTKLQSRQGILLP